MKKGYLSLVTTFLLSTVLILAIGCEGPTGPTGPEGPQGSQGEQGLQGEQGPPGTANVIYSAWQQFDSENWTDPFDFFGQFRREFPIAEDAVDESIIAEGTVMVYLRFSGTSDTIEPFPYIGPATKSEQQVLSFRLEIGSIIITFCDLDGVDDPGPIVSSSYRYIIIPGGTAAKANLPDLNDYYAVVEYYGIAP